MSEIARKDDVLQRRTRDVLIGMWDGSKEGAVVLVTAIKEMLSKTSAYLTAANVSLHASNHGPGGAEIRLTIVSAANGIGGAARDCRIYPGGAILFILSPAGEYLWSGVIPREAADALADDVHDMIVMDVAQPGPQMRQIGDGWYGSLDPRMERP